MNGPPAAPGTGPLGILGGTFDPVHNGHLRVALEASEALRLDEVRLVPLHQPNHRAPACASSAARVAMLAAAIRPPLVLELCEIERGGVSYTVDTLAQLRERYPQRALCLLLGRDAYHGLPAWHQPARVLELAHIIVVTRPDVGRAALAGLDELVGNAQSERVDDLHDSIAGRVFFLDIPLLPIASSDLRARLRDGRSVRHLVPESVAEQIRKRHLYQT